MKGETRQGFFTMPGEAGYEELCLDLAEKWGADMIRDSDGTQLSPALLDSGYGVYSTLCVVRGHNKWIKTHGAERLQQQCFLCTKPQIALDSGKELRIRLMAGFFEKQFKVNDTPESLALWQVFDRTAGTPAREGTASAAWSYDARTGEAVIPSPVPWHEYTVSFLAWRVWEEISMYNHITNHWDQEPLMQLDPIYPETREYLKQWLDEWCAARPATTVARFTSLFYNFTWIWGADARNRNLFTDWASYDFAVSPLALRLFKQEYGYSLCAEDFVRRGFYNATHRPPSKAKRDWMEFVAGFVRDFAKDLIAIVHRHGKKAYVFYDDTWIGLEPYNGHFQEFGFDGIIKCVFSGYEARLCAGVPVSVHELRFHPYLFPVGLGGAATFLPGGDPARDLRNYWLNIRRALLRQRVERAGLGGYTHLVRDFPDFVDAMTRLLDEFRLISALHEAGPPVTFAPKIGILHTWGSLRSWTLSGHFHETSAFTLIHILESLSGLPLDVRFISFEDIESGVPDGLDIIINVGRAGDAWSGGACWQNPDVCAALTQWAYNGGVFLGVEEPSAAEDGAASAGGVNYFRMAHVLGVDLDNGERACHGAWSYKLENAPAENDVPFFTAPESSGVLNARAGIVLISKHVRVLAERDGWPALTIHAFGKGAGIYMSGFRTTTADGSPSADGTPSAANRFLLELLLCAAGCLPGCEGLTDNPCVECAVFPGAGQLIFANNTLMPQTVSCVYSGKRYQADMEPGGITVLNLQKTRSRVNNSSVS
ncbi:MAG: 1,3-beta-galactosyl-N-acetylhexosamine phosphorylase [Clostridiales bacterium]|nr:1,3-beta-galactosyl-N-acetylhexosamine phosphorylase [Clostridiales bacterium]